MGKIWYCVLLTSILIISGCSPSSASNSKNDYDTKKEAASNQSTKAEKLPPRLLATKKSLDEMYRGDPETRDALFEASVESYEKLQALWSELPQTEKEKLEDINKKFEDLYYDSPTTHLSMLENEINKDKSKNAKISNDDVENSDDSTINISSPGIYEVGKDIEPGIYISYFDITYWARLSNFTGEDDILANDNSDPFDQVVVEIKKSDKGFQTNGDGFWKKIDLKTYPVDIQENFDNGVYIVGKDIAPGKYKSDGGGYWARLSNFSGENNIIANGNSDGPVIVEIKKTDKGFLSSNNATWKKVK
ncbi:hypothetical protein B4102_3408 [Heyndrickxia sporothermodurans]|uniref:Uncharacterized protein n=1 Tax=Heyndrickxia sporothermodurans TaxID=46224 RepID=A0A150KTW0_9BACI|nr:hypothetical protein [Heyndrickxia sporothermodurans]KYD03490.1 hypothetical protein B4102_3408 [Heyndrickxia sporothermodurans]